MIKQLLDGLFGELKYSSCKKQKRGHPFEIFFEGFSIKGIISRTVYYYSRPGLVFWKKKVNSFFVECESNPTKTRFAILVAHTRQKALAEFQTDIMAERKKVEGIR